jgi:class 3 adenylate cyclase
VRTARAIQQRWRGRRERLSHVFGPDSGKIGVGVDTGKVNFGEFGRAHQDLTAIGTVVNVASRAQSAAAAGEILVTEAVHERAGDELPESRAREVRLKGLDEPARLWAA